MPMSAAERAAAHRLHSAADVPPGWRPRTWHGARITQGTHAGLRGFVIGLCKDGCPDSFELLRPGSSVLYRCVPLSRLAPATTLHGGVSCPGDTCTEGELL